MAAAPCPCESGRAFAQCCEPYLRGEREPPDPEALMRSRYTAYAKGDAEYLWRTLDAEHADRARPREQVLFEIRRSSAAARWRGLRVLDRQPPGADGVARVLFLARIFVKGRDLSFVELSDFRHDGTGWRYWRGEQRAPPDARGLASLTIDSFGKAAKP